MRYALLADLHSSYADTLAVLKNIKEIAPDAEIVGLGDLHECHIGKKRARRYAFDELERIVTLDPDFLALLTFPSLLGNQEERILSIVPPGASPYLDRLRLFPREKRLGDALLIHGDELEWGYDWYPNTSRYDAPILFFGHSHMRGLYRKGKKLEAPLDLPISLKKHYAVNVGPVVFEREWLLYDPERRTITFRKAK